jgi:hypothetical protein
VIGVSVHNFVLVGVMACVFLILMKLANRTKLAQVPVIGSVLQFAEQAA